MAKLTTFELTEFNAESFLAWTITFKCGNTCNDKTKVGSTSLVDVDKSTTDHNLKLLAQGNSSISTNAVTVTVTISEATLELKTARQPVRLWIRLGVRSGMSIASALRTAQSRNTGEAVV